MSFIALVPPIYYNVKQYGAQGNGTTDDTTAIQTAITTAQTAGGGVVYFPPGTYIISNTLTISHDNMELIGAGWSSAIQAGSSMPAAPMIQVTVSSTQHRRGIKIAEMFINGNSITGVSGIELDNTYQALIDHVWIRFCPVNGVYLNGGPSSSFGAYTTIHASTISDGGAGIGLLTFNHEFNTITDCLFSFYNSTGGYGMKLQNGNNSIKGCTFDECDTSVWLFFTHNNSFMSCQFDRGLTQFIYLNGSKLTSFIGNFFGVFSGSGTKSMIVVDNSSNASNNFIGNYTQTGTTWTNFLSEDGATGTPGNTYTENTIGSLAVVRHNGVFKNNTGYNPVGSLTPPTVPATTVAQTNSFGVDAAVFVAASGATITAIAIGGISTGQTSGSFRVPAGQSITLTYSGGTPTWTWFGD